MMGRRSKQPFKHEEAGQAEALLVKLASVRPNYLDDLARSVAAVRPNEFRSLDRDSYRQELHTEAMLVTMGWIRHGHVPRDPDSLFKYVVTGVRHRFITHLRASLRRERHTRTLAEHLPTETRDTPATRAAEVDELAHVRRLIDGLPAEQARVVALRVFYDLPIDEIVRLTRLSLGTVKTRLHRAKKALRAALRRTSGDAERRTKSISPPRRPRVMRRPRL